MLPFGCTQVEINVIGYIINVMNKEESAKVSEADQGYLSAAVFAGMLVGGLLCGLFSDKLGRKSMYLLSLGLSFLQGNRKIEFTCRQILIYAYVLYTYWYMYYVSMSIYPLRCEYVGGTRLCAGSGCGHADMHPAHCRLGNRRLHSIVFHAVYGTCVHRNSEVSVMLRHR